MIYIKLSQFCFMAKYQAYSTKTKKKENTFTLQAAKLGMYFLQALQF